MKMKRVFILAAAALMSFGAFAQTDLNTLKFVDKNGNVVEDGSTITVTDVEEKEGQLQINSGLYVKNFSNEEQGTSMDFTILQMDNGAPQCCYPHTCIPGTNEVGKEYSTFNDGIEAGESLDMQTEWIPAGYGQCVMTFQLKIMNVTEKVVFGMPLKSYDEFKAYGPKITINFVYRDPAGINGIKADDAKVAAVYNMNGQLLSAPQKGVNIIKYTDGKTVKVTLDK